MCTKGLNVLVTKLTKSDWVHSNSEFKQNNIAISESKDQTVHETIHNHY